MTIFDQREQGFEAKYAHDQNLEFRIRARRNHLLGLWAGDLLGLKDDELALYTGTVLSADLIEPGDEDVLRKITADFLGANLEPSTAEIRVKMDELLAVARREIVTGE
jgi:hypothetical protein